MNSDVVALTVMRAKRSAPMHECYCTLNMRGNAVPTWRTQACVFETRASYEELRAEFLYKASPPAMPLPITCTGVDREVRPRWLVRKVWK